MSTSLETIENPLNGFIYVIYNPSFDTFQVKIESTKNNRTK